MRNVTALARREEVSGIVQARSFQCRALGVWPDLGSGVWSDSLWKACLEGPQPAFPLADLPQIGCDMGQGKGDDFHGIHGRWGAVSVHHETANTMDPVRVFTRIKAVALQLAEMATGRRDRNAAPIDPKKLPIKIDDDGTGNAIISFLRAGGYCVIPIGAGTSAIRPDLYPNKRSELWFYTAERAKIGQVWFGLLDRPTRNRLRQQLTAPEWNPDPAGRRKVEPKDDTKEKLGRSPDDADSMNLAYYDAPPWGEIPPADARPLDRMQPTHESSQARRGMFGVRPRPQL